MQEIETKIAELEAQIVQLEEIRDTLTGTDKGKCTKEINDLRAQIEELQNPLDGDTPPKDPDPKPAVNAAPVPGDTPPKDPDPKPPTSNVSDKTTVKNVGKYTLVDPVTGVRYSPNSEVPTALTGYVKSQLDAGLFVDLKR